jgi:MFS family permease
MHVFSKDRIIAPPGFNRWLVPPASIAIHLCIGSVYAWSIFNPPLVKVKGVVASAAEDWTLSQVVWIFTVAIVFLGLSAAFAGKWLERVGPRTVGTVAALCWGGGFFLGAAGIWLHQLWLLYLGYGVIGGCGLGLGYVSPVSTLIKWFPDRRGMAAGMAIMGFGGGAIIGAPLKESLLSTFYVAPDYLGREDKVPLVTEDGKRFAQMEGAKRQVVVIGASEASQLAKKGPEGVYVVGTGSTGVAQTFLMLGAAYLVVMLVAAFSYRLPAPDWKPAGWTPPAEGASGKMITARNVGIDRALRTPQFYLLWIVLCFNVSAGIGILGVAKTMMLDIFGAALPSVIDNRFANVFVLMTSLFNMLGRFAWASASDYLGRKTTYTLFFVAGAALYLAIPICAWQASVSQPMLWLVVFYAVVMVIFTMYGGGFATIPAYLADLFGTRFVGGIHGRLLTAWSTAGVLGPIALTTLRERTSRHAAIELASRVEPEAFAAKFGAPLEQLEALLESKTVTLAKLMEIVPAGTVNPSFTLYNTTMYLMAGLLICALAANLLVRPVAKEHHLKEL